jgi:hypothetical protein
VIFIGFSVEKNLTKLNNSSFGVHFKQEKLNKRSNNKVNKSTIRKNIAFLTNVPNPTETSMNKGTKSPNLPNLIADLLGKVGLNIDNLFADLCKLMEIANLLHRSGFHKRSGLDVMQVVYLLLLWVWLKTYTIDIFSRQSMRVLPIQKKDVMYDFLQREDI